MESHTEARLPSVGYQADPALAFETHSDMVYRLAFVRTGNKTDADDILSEVFLRLVKNQSKIESEEHLKAWLIRVTINCSHSLFSRIKHRKESALNDCQTVVFMENSEVLPAVLKLPNKQKTILYMYYFEGYSVAEIGTICSIPVGTVKSRLARARESLRAELKGANIDV